MSLLRDAARLASAALAASRTRARIGLSAAAMIAASDLAASSCGVYAGVVVDEAHWLGLVAALVVYALSARPKHGTLALAAFALLAAPLRAAILAVAALRIGPWVSLGAAALATSVFFALCGSLASKCARPRFGTALAAALIAYALLLRLAYFANFDLIPEEAYYWLYSRHPALGYLDHPPMVSWLIGAGTAAFGNGELGARGAMLLCAGAAGWFVYRAAAESFGARTGWVALALASVLPYTFASSMLATPDSPLIAAWAGTAMFLRRALLHGHARSWIGAGVCLGAGMLAKYSIALLVPAALLYMLLERDQRRALAKPWPYLGAAIALVAFAPVIVWNARNGWASFAYQSVERLEDKTGFYVHELAYSAGLMLTPVGVGAIARVLVRGKSEESAQLAKERRFAAVFVLVPLSVFALNSLRHTVHLHWLGPIGIAALPLVAHHVARFDLRSFWLGPRVWLATATVTMVVCGLSFHYLAIGLPGLGYVDNMRMPVAWRELAGVIEAAEGKVGSRSDPPLLVVGSDRNFISSELAFYRHGGGDWRDVTSRQVFGRRALMFDTWQPREQFAGRDLLIVGHTRDDIARCNPQLVTESLGEYQTLEITKRGRRIADIVVCVARGYRPAPRIAQPASTPSPARE